MPDRVGNPNCWFSLAQAQLYHCRGNVSVEGRGIGIERPDGLVRDDDEYDAFRKRMMLAYRFRPNPLVRTGPEVINLFSCSAQLSLKFILLINVKMPTLVGILTFMSRIKYQF